MSHTTRSQFLSARVCSRKDKYSFESNRQIGYLPSRITSKIKKISGGLVFVFQGAISLCQAADYALGTGGRRVLFVLSL